MAKQRSKRSNRTKRGDLKRRSDHFRELQKNWREEEETIMVSDNDSELGLARKYADKMVHTPFNPVTRKEEVRAQVIAAWLDGFRRAREMAQAEAEGRPI